MNALTFTLKLNSASKIDCARLTPNGLAGLSIAQINNLSLSNSKNSAKVSDYFEVSGNNNDNIVFKNSRCCLNLFFCSDRKIFMLIA